VCEYLALPFGCRSCRVCVAHERGDLCMLTRPFRGSRASPKALCVEQLLHRHPPFGMGSRLAI